MGKKLTQQEFLERAYKVHGDKYNLSSAVYVNNRTKVVVNCQKHGDFLISPSNLCKGHGCPKCAIESQAIKISKPHHTFEQDVERAKKVQNNKFDYIKPDVYKGVNQKIVVICKDCGYQFKQSLSSQIAGVGCPRCKAIATSKRSKGKPLFLLRKPVCGIGIYDCEDVCAHSPIIAIWREMIKRCNNDVKKTHRPTYQDCKVCDDWLVFSNYKKWYEEHYVEGFQVDKDLFGGKLYSPQTCVFLPSEINSFLVVKNGKNGLPTGITRNETAYLVKCGNVYLGAFKLLDDAKNEYIKEKKKQLLFLANKWKDKIEKRAYDALVNLDIVKHFKLH